MGAISVNEKIAYHLFSVDTNCSNIKESVNLIRKSKWHSQYTNMESKFDILLELFFWDLSMILYLDNAISGLDFDPLGTVAASIDHYSVCQVSNINSNEHSFHHEIDDDTLYGNLSNYLFSLFENLLSFYLLN